MDLYKSSSEYITPTVLDQQELLEKTKSSTSQTQNKFYCVLKTMTPLQTPA